MNTYYLSALDEQFKYECKVINLSYEYPGYTGKEKWAIITYLTEKELIEKYDEIISSYKPFILLFSLFGSVRADYIRNEDKFSKRAKRSISMEFRRAKSLSFTMQKPRRRDLCCLQKSGAGISESLSVQPTSSVLV